MNNKQIKQMEFDYDPYRWKVSSNAIFNYMKKFDYLKLILENQAIIPRYVNESLGYLQIPNVDKLAFPMTCFCDIPLSKSEYHIKNYGEYGIGFSKQRVIEKFGIQLVHYMAGNSPLTNDFREAMIYSMDENGDTLSDYLLSTLLYMKPVCGFDEEGKHYVFQDECEWRYIPTKNFPNELNFILDDNYNTQRMRDAYSEALVNHKETWLSFEWDDIKYLIVPNDDESKKLKEVINNLATDDNVKEGLLLKVLTTDQIKRKNDDC